jgi:hypothetical protein
MGLPLERIKMDEQSLLLENPLLKILLLEDERNDWVNPIFNEREKCDEIHSLFPMLLHCASHSGFRSYTACPKKIVLFSKIFIPKGR